MKISMRVLVDWITIETVNVLLILVWRKVFPFLGRVNCGLYLIQITHLLNLFCDGYIGKSEADVFTFFNIVFVKCQLLYCDP